ncbi:arsenate reductase [Thiomicrospira sp. S5]|uniref:arsenate reductase n=1 Tax=Thiomicrospira sp. S5 TaxID=1803865 RepID=UPI000F89F907|nr:arsenate reductase [Thiomicrospira sp. S5]AZR82019.1 arsenate reductase [Thiomicrospira sp. S5]
MKPITLYGIPNCDTVRKARKFLDTQQVDYQFHDFRKNPLTLDTLQHWLAQQPIDVIVNKRSTGWKQLNDEQKQQLMAGDNLELLAEIPTLIKRPVLQTETALLFGFKEADYQQAL